MRNFENRNFNFCLDGKNRKNDFLSNKHRQITNAIYLVGTNRGLYAGHAALILVDDKGAGVLYSSQFDTKKLGEITKGKWIEYEIFRQELSAKQIKSYFKTGKIPSKNSNLIARYYLSEYDKYINIPVKNKDLGRFMYERAEKLHENPGMFNLYERNCNHLSQDILSAGGLNFTSTSGSVDMFTEKVENVKEYVKQWRLLKALYYSVDEYRRFFDLGIVPNGAYEKGVEWAKKNNFEYGHIGKPKFVIKEEINKELKSEERLSIENNIKSRLDLKLSKKRVEGLIKSL